MSDYRRHEGWCPHGAAPDGRRRFDLFPEYGDAFPLWEAGNGVHPTLSPELTEALYEWNRVWEARSDPGGTTRADADAQWHDEGDALGRRVEAEVDVVVVVLGPERTGGAPLCENCGRYALDHRRSRRWVGRLRRSVDRRRG